MQKIIIDTDIGDDIDDAFALLTALGTPQFELLGVTTVFKNTPQRARLARRLLRLAGRPDVPVYAGLETPENGAIERWEYENVDADGKIRIHHYSDDMAGETYESGSAVDFILDTAGKYPGEVTLIALGPYMNVAAAYRKDRERFGLLKEAFIMGGQLAGTYPEWNVRVDPAAAQTFFASGLSLTCVGLDVTTKCRLNDGEQARVNGFTAPALALTADMMRLWIETNHMRGGVRRYPTMHDPLCVLCAADDSLCSFEKVRLTVGQTGDARAKTLRADDGAPVRMAVGVDTAAFYERFFGALDNIR